MFGESESAGVFLGRDLGHTRNYSEETANQIDEEVERFISEAMENAKRKISEHMDKLKIVAEYLIENEKVDGDKFLELIKDEETV